MMNQITLMGRLVRDPEVKKTQSGTALANFCIAVDRDSKPQNAEKYKTDFINCVAWGNRAEFAGKYMKKGNLYGLMGRLEINQYEDEQGSKRTSAQVNVTSIYFGSSKGSTQAAPAASAEPAMMQSEFAMLEDDEDGLPF